MCVYVLGVYTYTVTKRVKNEGEGECVYVCLGLRYDEGILGVSLY